MTTDVLGPLSFAHEGLEKQGQGRGLLPRGSHPPFGIATGTHGSMVRWRYTVRLDYLTIGIAAG